MKDVFRGAPQTQRVVAFKPKPDITAYELAQIFERADMQLTEDFADIVMNIRELSRHFEEKSID